MKTGRSDLDYFHQLSLSATYPLARPGVRLVLSLLVAGMSLLPRLFAPATRPIAPAGTSNCGF
jgi:hypothetical protein